MSARIVELLGTRAFSLDWELLPQIHRHLFQDLDASVYHPGILRDEDVYCKPLFARPELVRNVDSAFAAPMQEELKRLGIAGAVLAKPE